MAPIGCTSHRTPAGHSSGSGFRRFCSSPNPRSPGPPCGPSGALSLEERSTEGSLVSSGALGLPEFTSECRVRRSATPATTASIPQPGRGSPPPYSVEKLRFEDQWLTRRPIFGKGPRRRNSISLALASPVSVVLALQAIPGAEVTKGTGWSLAIPSRTGGHDQICGREASS